MKKMIVTEWGDRYKGASSSLRYEFTYSIFFFSFQNTLRGSLNSLQTAPMDGSPKQNEIMVLKFYFSHFPKMECEIYKGMACDLNSLPWYQKMQDVKTYKEKEKWYDKRQKN